MTDLFPTQPKCFAVNYFSFILQYVVAYVFSCANQVAEDTLIKANPDLQTLLCSYVVSLKRHKNMDIISLERNIPKIIAISSHEVLKISNFQSQFRSIQRPRRKNLSTS